MSSIDKCIFETDKGKIVDVFITPADTDTTSIFKVVALPTESRTAIETNNVDMSYFTIVLFILLTIFQDTYTLGNKSGLYSATDDDVVVFNKATFNSTVLGSKTVWVVEFYNSWCGHCINFAPTWKSLATDIKGWRRVVNIGAVDCSSKDNLELCHHYDVKYYPVIKFFLPFSEASNLGEDFNEQNPTTIRHKIVDYISNISGVAARAWPNLQPLGSVEKIWEDARDEHKHVALVFEDENSYTGRETILDLSDHKTILVRRALKSMLVQFGIRRYPSLYLLHSDGRYQRLSSKNSSRESYVASLKDVLTDGIGEVENTKGDNSNINTLQDKNNKLYFQKSNRPMVYMQDLESTLTYILRQEVAIHREIDFKSLMTLKKFLQVLAMYFPGREEVTGFLWRVHTVISGTTSELSGLHWLHSIEGFQTVDTYLPDTIQWIGCKGSQRQFRGYPCGMWTLFHTLTVNAYHIERKNPKHSPQEVLKSIARYMKSFFGCVQCSQHFEKMAKKIKEDVITKEDAVLWLWKAHNLVNVRLKGDPSEDPIHPKIQFPPKEICSKCHTAESSADKPVWNLKEVLKFLLMFYHRDNIVPIDDDDESFKNKNFKGDSLDVNSKKNLDWWEKKQRRQDLAKIRELRNSKRRSRSGRIKGLWDDSRKQIEYLGDYENDRTNSRNLNNGLSWNFTRIDLGLCVMFYVVCGMIVLYMYYHFMIRRKKNFCTYLPF